MAFKNIRKKKAYIKKYYLNNKDKIKESNRLYYLKNKKRIKKINKLYFVKNKDKIKEKSRLYYLKNLERIKLYYLNNKEKFKKKNRLYLLNNKEKRKKYNIRYRLNNPHIQKFLNASEAKRRAAKLRATPKFANLNKIKEIYKNCPKGYHVDHIIPLQGKNVCGLHVEWNLQYLTPSENLSKYNKLLNF
jgi:hypothetical protein